MRTFSSPDNISDEFGDLSLSGNRLLVGARNPGGVGKAWVFDITTGQVISTLLNPEPATGDWFGVRLAIEGTTAVVGALFDDFGATDAGSVYVFNALTGGAPTAIIRNPSPATGDSFGSDLGISHGRIVVPAHGDDTVASNSGAAYIFDAASGTLLQTLVNPLAKADDRFGYGVGISGERVAVGIWEADRQFTNSGAVAVFDVITGELETLIDNPNPSPEDYFGTSYIRFAGDTLLIGAGGEDRPSSNSGAGYIYQLQDSVACEGHLAGWVSSFRAQQVPCDGRCAVLLCIHLSRWK